MNKYQNDESNIRQANDERPQVMDAQVRLSRWKDWLVANEALTAKILAERNNQLLDVDAILADHRADLVNRP